VGEGRGASLPGTGESVAGEGRGKGSGKGSKSGSGRRENRWVGADYGGMARGEEGRGREEREE
jgi:hypothetical protein